MTRTCVASGLDEGTDYDFRVRAVPAEFDTTNWPRAILDRDGVVHLHDRPPQTADPARRNVAT